MQIIHSIKSKPDVYDGTSFLSVFSLVFSFRVFKMLSLIEGSRRRRKIKELILNGCKEMAFCAAAEGEIGRQPHCFW